MMRFSKRVQLSWVGFLRWSAIAAVVCAAPATPAAAITFDVIQLTDNDYLDFNAQISGTNIVWESPGNSTDSDREIQFFNGTTTTQLTTNTYQDLDPQISGSNVTWWAQTGGNATTREIFYYDGTVTQVTNDSVRDELPAISGSEIVWQSGTGTGFETYYWDGSAQNISNNAVADREMQIHNGKAVWVTNSTVPMIQIAIYDSTTDLTTPLTTDGINKENPQIFGNNVTWEGNDGDWEIYYHDGLIQTKLTTNTFVDSDPQVSNVGVVWWGGVFNDFQISMYDFETQNTTELSTGLRNQFPQIAGANVVWQHFDGNDEEIFFWNGSTVQQITDNDYDDRNPQISGVNLVWEAELTDIGGMSTEIMYAVPALPGDVNDDGVVNGLDANIISSNFLNEPATYGEGDVNGDGVVNGLDANIVSQHFLETNPASPIPEPWAGTMLVIGVAVASLRRRR